MRCQATNAAGERCGSPERFVDEETGYCPAHGPEAEQHMRKVSTQGGKATARKHRRPPLEDRDVPPPPETLEDARKWLAWVADNLARGVLDQKEARSLSYTLRAFMDSVEKSAVQEEIEELKAKLSALREGKLKDFTEEVA